MNVVTRTSWKDQVAVIGGTTDTGGRRRCRWFPFVASLLLVGPACDRGTAPLGDRLPEARSSFERACSGCHPLDVPLRRHKSLEGWKKTVAEMRGKGASLTAQEAEDVARYLAQIRGR